MGELRKSICEEVASKQQTDQANGNEGNWCDPFKTDTSGGGELVHRLGIAKDQYKDDSGRRRNGSALEAPARSGFSEENHIERE